MICHRVEMVEQAKEHLKETDEQALNDSLHRVALAKERLARPTTWDMNAYKDIDEQIWDLRVDTLGEEKAKDLSVEDGKRSPVELY